MELELRPTDFVDLFDRPGWHRRAACRGLGPARFFPSPTTRNPTAAVWRARQVCDGCEVQSECAMAGERERAGIWGGELHGSNPKRKAGYDRYDH